MTIRTAILISGGGSNMVRLVEDMQRPGHCATPVLVLSSDANAGGLKKAEELGIETAVVEASEFVRRRADFDAAIHDRLQAADVELVCLAGFMRILGAEIVAKWADRMLNIHPSLLPKFKGLDTHARAIAAGESEHGCSVHLVTAALDDGPILDQARVSIAADDKAETLAARVLVEEHKIYPKVLREYASRLADHVPKDAP